MGHARHDARTVLVRPRIFSGHRRQSLHRGSVWWPRAEVQAASGRRSVALLPANPADAERLNAMKQPFLANTIGVSMLLALLTAVVPAITHGQGQANFSGTWKLSSADPPVPIGRGGGGGNNGPYAATMFAPAPDTMTITQSASSITVQIG